MTYILACYASFVHFIAWYWFLFFVLCNDSYSYHNLLNVLAEVSDHAQSHFLRGVIFWHIPYLCQYRDKYTVSTVLWCLKCIKCTCRVMVKLFRSAKFAVPGVRHIRYMPYYGYGKFRLTEFRFYSYICLLLLRRFSQCNTYIYYLSVTVFDAEVVQESSSCGVLQQQCLCH